MKSKYQTLSEFFYKPFHKDADSNKDATYNMKYHEYISKNKIKLHSVCQVEDSYYFHIKIPSESKKEFGYEYDVVIRFFPEDEETANQRHLRNYKIQFFSNSPSFMYKYAYLYHKEDYLISALYDKVDADYIDTPPEKTNPNMVTSYDKSIYFACRFLFDKQFRILNKNGPMDIKMVNQDKFFNDISTFRDIKVDQALINEEKKLKSSLSQAKRNVNNKKNDLDIKENRKNLNSNKDKTVSSITIITKKGAKPKIFGKPRISAKKPKKKI